MTFKFSIVINTYNRATLLDDAISGLSELAYPNFEVIVVNGPSTDHTEEVLKKWEKKVKIGKCEQPNLAMSRNIGIEMASGDIIAFIDDDAVPHPAWLTHLAKHYHDPKIGGVGGFTIDNTGIAYQARKTVCDRFGNAYFTSDFFDERPLSFVGSPFYPSLLGTNSSFRATALREIGGFDHAFAYLLDETDVCLRLVDQGYSIVYEPNALVYHQFAPSHIRSKNKIPKTLYPSAVSKSYFIRKHGSKFSEQRAIEELKKYEEEILTANKWLVENNKISQQHRVSLDEDLLFGIQDGNKLAMQAILSNKHKGDLNTSKVTNVFLPMLQKQGVTIALISRSYPTKQESGIARWTWMMASGLAAQGHKVHVITLASPEPFTRYENGYWIHAIEEDTSENRERFAVYKKIPPGLAGWCIAVEKEVKKLKDWGLEVVSFPIWDVEGMALVGDESIGVVMSLHTSYALAKPFKPEWSERPLFEHFHVNKVIEAEKKLLQNVPHILANSHAIVDDLTKLYSVEFSDRTVIVPHGTLDPLASEQTTNGKLTTHYLRSNPVLKVAYVGRFESRKGFDLACKAFAALLNDVKDIEISFVGDNFNENAIRVIKDNEADSILTDNRVIFKGIVTRIELDQLYIQSDVVVIPSRYESFGLVAIEAMAAGTPVIALANGGLKEIVEDGETGFLIPPEKNAAQIIKERLIHLAKNPELLDAMKYKARQAYIEKFTIDRMVEAAEKIYLVAARRSI